MRVSLEWLGEYCQPTCTVAELAQRLAATGTEVDHILTHGVSEPDGFFVGHIISVEGHPDADRLRVCQVDLGGEKPQQIVCGAPNVAAGQTVAVVTPGARMPDGTKLKKAKLRGVESHGMILAEDEIGLGAGHAGIMVLDNTYKPGTPLAQVLPIGTDVLELEITPNRPDCLSIYGVAREVHAATGAPLTPPPWQQTVKLVQDQLSQGLAGVEVVVKTHDLCPKFTALCYENVTVGPSPLWLKARLMAVGQRPINNVVDITNYVMLLTGQPLHAFDLDKIVGGRLTVAEAQGDEEILTLDGVTRTLPQGTLTIFDGEGPVAIAGVMGGARCEVDENTKTVLLEVATWDGPTIQRTSSQLALRSDASARFEKGLAPEQTYDAQAVAKDLLVALCSADICAGGIDLGASTQEALTLTLRPQALERIVGVDIPLSRQEEILRTLDFSVTQTSDGLSVQVPYVRRQDITREIDLVEEVARIYGFDRVPARLPARRQAIGRLGANHSLQRKMLDVLTQQGFFEVVGWSFTDEETNSAFGCLPQNAVSLANPMAKDQSQLRATLMQSLLSAARHNASYGAERIQLIESGTVFCADNAREGHAKVCEQQHLAVISAWQRTNLPNGQAWAQQAPAFFALKGVLDSLFLALHLTWSLEPLAEPIAWLHPGRAASISCQGTPVGWFGELHPNTLAQWGLEQYHASAYELDFAKLYAQLPETLLYREVPSVPDVHEDLAIVFAEGVVAQTVREVVQQAAGNTLKSVEVFDYYVGEHIPEGKVSLGLRLLFNAQDRTLESEEITTLRHAILKQLKEQLGGELRQ